jgi:hypothetical protein
MTYVISNHENPINFPSYNTDNIGNFILIHEPPTIENYVPLMCEGEKFDPSELWTLHFDGAYNREGKG